MKKYTEKELYAFVSRIDSLEKCQKAEAWITAHWNDIGSELADELMMAVTYMYREFYRV